MFVVSPAAILYDQAGNPVAVSPDVAIPAGTSTILVAGTDGTDARILSVDSTGKLAIQNPSNLDTQLSTRLSTSAFTARVNTLGQKDMANSTPMVIASDQSAIPVTDNGGSLTIDGTVSANLNSGTNYVGRIRQTDGTLDLTLLNAAPPSDTGQVAVPVRIISSLAAGGGGGGTSSNYTQAFPATGTAVGFTDGTNMQGARVFDADTGAGTQYVLGANLRISASGGSTEAAAGAGTTSASTLRVVLPTDQTAIPVTDNGGSITVDGTVTANQGTAAALAGAWPVEVTDGTNTLPTGDAVARSIFTQISDATNGPVAVKAASTAALAADPSLVTAFSPNSPLPSGTNEVGFVAQGTAAALADYWPVGVTDGTNVQPTGDVAARAIYGYVTDGTNTTAVKAASTAALAADPSLVTAFSPNSPLPVGTNQIGKIEQGTAAPLAGRWPVQVTDGTNTMPTMDVAARSGYVRVTDGTNTQPTGDVNARAIWTQIGDGTTGPAAVIAGNASPLLTDKSLNVQISPNQDPIPTTVVPATSTPGTAQGKVLIGTAGTYSVVRSTTYVEQTTQAQRSIVSSSASDSSAGTGARQVKITYYDATCTGPFYETVTMNGTTAANTVATDICFIERMDVVSVGSNSYNVGTLSLYTGTGATGTIFASIGVGNLVTGLGDNETLYAHHYVGATTETKVVSVITGVTSSAAGGGRQEAFLKYRNPTVATSPTLLYGDVVTNSQGNALVRPYSAPQTLSGPSVIVGFVIPVANNTTSYFGFDYADEPV